MSQSDWVEALRLLETGDADEVERHRLANIVRDEVEHLQRGRPSPSARAGAPRAHREREVGLVMEPDGSLGISVALYDTSWLAQLFLDTHHAPSDLRFRLDDSGAFFRVAPLSEESELREGDRVFKGVQGIRLSQDGRRGFFRAESNGVVEAIALEMTSPPPPKSAEQDETPIHRPPQPPEVPVDATARKPTRA